MAEFRVPVSIQQPPSPFQVRETESRMRELRGAVEAVREILDQMTTHAKDSAIQRDHYFGLYAKEYAARIELEEKLARSRKDVERLHGKLELAHRHLSQ